MQIDCQNIKVYGSVQGRLISHDGLVEVYGPVFGNIISDNFHKYDKVGVIIRGDIDKYASVLCKNGNIEIYGNSVSGNISGRCTEMIIKSDVLTGSIFSESGIYVYLTCKMSNVLWLKLNDIKNVFVDCNLKVRCMFAFDSKFYVRKGKEFRLSDKCQNCEIFSLSSKFWRFGLSELRNLIKLNVTDQVIGPLAIGLQGVVINPLVISKDVVYGCTRK